MAQQTVAGYRVTSKREAPVVSALFDNPEAVETALVGLIRTGLPRDLIDVVVTQQAAKQFYTGRFRNISRRATMRYAGTGGLIGLIMGAIGSLGIIIMPGLGDPGLVAIVQLLGPNLTTISGALIGALIGAFVPRQADWRHRRAAEAPNSIVMVITIRTSQEADTVSHILTQSGGSAVKLDPVPSPN